MSNRYGTDQPTKATPAGTDYINIADVSDDNNTKKSLLSSLWSAIFGSRNTDDIPEGSTNLYYTDTRVASNTITLTNKTIDADATGNVITNIGSSEVKGEMISGQTTTAITSGDFLMFSDTSDSGNLKKLDIDNLPPAPDASTTVKGIAFIATDADAATGTNTTKILNPKQAKDNYGTLIEVAQTSRAIGTASSSEVIAHSLGVVPKYVLVEARGTHNNTNTVSSSGVSNGSFHKSVYVYEDYSGGTKLYSSNSSTASIYIQMKNSNSSFTYASVQTATITLSSTNITINWTGTVGASGPATEIIYVTLTLIY